jgi:hypothetical protein
MALLLQPLRAAEPVGVFPSAVRRSDLALLRRELPARHPNLFFKTSRAEFERRLSELEADAGASDRLGFALRLQEILAAQGDTHTEVNWPAAADPRLALPLQIHRFVDGWRVLAAPASEPTLPGTAVLALNGLPLDEVERRIARLTGRPNEPFLRHRLPGLVNRLDVLRHLGLADAHGPLALTVRDDTGAERTVTLAAPSPAADGATPRPARFRPKEIPLYLSNERALFWLRPLPEEKTLYVQYNRCWGREYEERIGKPESAKNLPSVDEFFTDVLRRVQDDGCERLIVDLRHNSGGSSLPGQQFVAALARNRRLNQPGRIFVIIGRRTFSSAALNAVDFRNRTRAILVGEPTSASPNHFGEVKSLLLPATGLTVFHSTKHFTPDKTNADTIHPDLVAEPTWADYAAGVDPALEAVKRYHSP